MRLTVDSSTLVKKNIPTLWIDDLLWQVKNGNHRWNNTKDSDGFRWIQMDSASAQYRNLYPSRSLSPQPTDCLKLDLQYIAVHGLFLFEHVQTAIGKTGRTSLHMSETSKGKRMSPRTRPRIPGSPGQGNINCKDRGHHSHGFPCGNSFLCRALGQW